MADTDLSDFADGEDDDAPPRWAREWHNVEAEREAKARMGSDE
jgi:hypothetical protein